MEYLLTPHAEKRMTERLIPKKLIKDALRRPTKVSYDASGRLLIKKLYRKKGAGRLLLIVGEPTDGRLKVITVIDTSKVRKYL